MTVSLDQDILDTMSPEELAAIQDAEYSPEELAAMKGVADEGSADNDDDDDAAATVDDSDAAQAKPVAAAEVAADPVADTSVQDTAPVRQEAAAADDADSFRPQYVVQLPADFQEQVNAVGADYEKLAQQLKDGEIDFDEYHAKSAEVLARRDELSAIRVKHEISAEMSQQNSAQEWQWTIKRFMARTARDEGIDYNKDADKARDLDLFVKALGNDPANADKDMDWFLTEGHRRVKAMAGIATAAAPANSAQAVDKNNKPTRKSPVSSAPVTLAHVPGSDGPGDLAGEFAALDALDGEDLENAIARMPEAQRIRFAQGL